MQKGKFVLIDVDIKHLYCPDFDINVEITIVRKSLPRLGTPIPGYKVDRVQCSIAELGQCPKDGACNLLDQMYR